jgi:hypothetical protein
VAESYRIADEPRPSSLSRLAVNPIWPLLGMMFGGAWLCWPWFALNALAIGSATRRAEIVTLVFGAAATAASAAAVGTLLQNGSIGEQQLPYAVLSLITVKLLVAYRVQLWQSRSFELFEYFGGAAKSGMLVLVLAWFGRQQLVKLNDWFWFLVLS